MRTDPFYDTWLYFLGQWPDQSAIGPWRWVFVILFAALLVAGLVVAVMEWRRDVEQRRIAFVVDWAFRVLVGGMWWVNTLWKLPLFSEDNGLHYWIEQEQKSAAFGWLRGLVGDVFLQTPVFTVIDVVTFFVELGFAVSLILGLGVRLMGAIGVLFVAQLWLGLYRQENEWPWTYVFLMMLMGLFAVHACGRRLGLDAALRRWAAGRGGPVAAIARAVS